MKMNEAFKKIIIKIKENYHLESIFFIPLFALSISLILFAVALVNGWFGAIEGGGDCEQVHPGLIKEPINTLSNIGFMISGLSMGWILRKGIYQKNNNSLTRSFFYSIFFPTLVVLIGTGSMAKHATETYIGGFFVMLSMYLFASFIASYAIQRFFKLSILVFGIMFFFMLSSCIISHFLPFHILFNFFGITAFAFYVLIAFIVEFLNIYVRKMRHEIHWYYFTAFLFALAFIFWMLSKPDALLCNPQSIIQGHSIWHLLNAVALFCSFRYYVSENSDASVKLPVR